METGREVRVVLGAPRVGKALREGMGSPRVKRALIAAA